MHLILMKHLSGIHWLGCRPQLKKAQCWPTGRQADLTNPVLGEKCILAGPQQIHSLNQGLEHKPTKKLRRLGFCSLGLIR